ncbi:MAG: glycosyltransferase [Thermodesulfobacteriota bacterium]|nr:glycosyltransferase [Thermodesulfobacteriota bacterium]
MEIKDVNPEHIKKADIIVGIPSYNEAKNISYPVIQADLGLLKYFNKFSSVIINCDNNSPDNTRDVFLETPTESPKIYLSTPRGIKGKGNNFRNLFNKATQLKAKAIIVIDADLKSITPEWINKLGEPLFLDYDYVAPIYLRHKYDGTITNNIAYPLLRSLYGRRIRQPIGGDFGFSNKLCSKYLNNNSWDYNISNFGIDIWMTNNAITNGSLVCQAFLDAPKVHEPKDPGSQLGTMFIHVIGTIFNLMEKYDHFWLKVKGSKPTAIFGFGLGERVLPPKISVSLEKLYNNFNTGLKEFYSLWENIIEKEHRNRLIDIACRKIENFEIPMELWAKILYDFSLNYHIYLEKRKEILTSLVPLYHGQTLSYARATWEMDAKQAEEYIEKLCFTFEEQKPYLVKRWKKN